MGHPKQLLNYQGKPLIEVVTGRMSQTGHPVTVVLGAYQEQILARTNLPDRRIKPPGDLNERSAGPLVETIFNSEWEQGISSSIRSAVSYLESHYPQTDHILFCLGDQPHLLTEHFEQLIQRSSEYPDKIVASHYDGRVGAPMIFPAKYFTQLKDLSGDQGAGKWVRKIPDEVISVDLPEAAIDWDRPGDID